METQTEQRRAAYDRLMDARSRFFEALSDFRRFGPPEGMTEDEFRVQLIKEMDDALAELHRSFDTR